MPSQRATRGARAAGVSLVLSEIAEWVLQQSAPDDVLLVEGVGGLLCPLTEIATVADLARLLSLPLIVVAPIAGDVEPYPLDAGSRSDEA